MTRVFIYSLVFFLPTTILSQASTAGNRWVDSVMNIIYTDETMDAETKSSLADSAFQISKKEGNICKQIYIRNKQATYLDNMGMSDSALTQLYWASKSYQQNCDSILLMSLFR
ncbi:MAG TPA: hypothetical protein VMZ69_10755, partial [Saprospiraceae bacterium]|nr:hypothetical protein [Saprospiraceae bacterium]